MQENKEFLEAESLSPYERYQLERWGNILNNSNPLEEFFGSEQKIATAEENYFFSLQNQPA